MKIEPLLSDGDLPQAIRPGTAAESGLDALLEWGRTERAQLDRLLSTHGGLLFRGFSVDGATDFERFCREFQSELKNYVGGDSPRTAVTEKVYTSTEYPSHLEIPLHNEMSYSRNWPARIFFFCDVEPQEGGATPIGDSRRILAALDPALRERFATRGVRYTRNLHGGWGMGKSWQETFETSDRATVEQRCTDAGLEFRWTDDDTLWVAETRPAVIEHPTTGDRVWFNQADLWHVTTMGSRRAETMLKRMGEAELPQHAFYGDGGSIDPADLDAVREACRQVRVVFPWRQGDLLMLDNVLVAHGRLPFKGERRILAAMG